MGRMTGKQWLACRDPEPMATRYGDRFTERKARLIMLACCRRHPKYLRHKSVRTMIDLLAKHYADPKKPDKPFDSAKLRTLYKKLEAHASSFDFDDNPARGIAFGAVAAAEPVSITEALNDSLSYLVMSCTSDIACALGDDDEEDTAESAAQADIVRDVLGNPFRRIAVKRAWFTETAVALARQAYQSEDFSLMPILADALQDAGCDNEDILNHCRDAKQIHVRGCWVIDLVLGKA